MATISFNSKNTKPLNIKVNVLEKDKRNLLNKIKDSDKTIFFLKQKYKKYNKLTFHLKNKIAEKDNQLSLKDNENALKDQALILKQNESDFNKACYLNEKNKNKKLRNKTITYVNNIRNLRLILKDQKKKTKSLVLKHLFIESCLLIIILTFLLK